MKNRKNMHGSQSWKDRSKFTNNKNLKTLIIYVVDGRSTCQTLLFVLQGNKTDRHFVQTLQPNLLSLLEPTVLLVYKMDHQLASWSENVFITTCAEKNYFLILDPRCGTLKSYNLEFQLRITLLGVLRKIYSFENDVMLLISLVLEQKLPVTKFCSILVT